MEALVAVQKDLKSNISKGYINFKKSPKDRITIQYLETRLDLLENQWSKFEENHRELIASYWPEEADQKDETYFTSEMYDSVEENYIEYKSSIKIALASLTTTVSHKTSVKDTYKTESNAVKLPKIVLPTFSGKYMEWPTFHDLFDSLINQSSSLANVQKLHYLKSHLTGEAEQLLRHIPITEANYEKCWQQLKKRYSNKRYITNCILTRLVGQKALTAESSNGVKQLLDTTNDCMNALANLGVETDNWDLIVIHLINLRLDVESRKLWEHKMSDHSDELPTLKEFNQFLESRFRALEFLEPREKRETKAKDTVEKPKKVFTVTTTTPALSCPFCSENHLLYQCKKFGSESFDRRHEFVQKQRLCFNCFGTSHTVTNCKKNTSCRRCSRRHHSLLHPEGSSGLSHHSEFKSATEPVEREESERPEGNQQHISTHVASGSIMSPGQVVLATALVKIEHKGKVYTLRALLDQGSQASFITEHATQMLGLRKTSVRGIVSGLGGDQLNLSVQCMVQFKLQSICTSFSCDVQAYVLSKLSSTLPTQKFNIQDWSELTGLVLADPRCDTPNKIDILLGAEVYGQILLNGLLRNSPGNLTAQNTQLGWILSGRVEIHNHSANHNVVSMHIQDNSVNELLRKFWELETEQPVKLLSQEDQQCENHFDSTTTRDKSGRYVVRLPFRDSDPACQYGDLKSIATRRFLLLEKKLNKDSHLKQEYSKVMNEYLELNHMEPIHDAEETARPDCAYLPHHAVVREDRTTTKVRVVFDASCKGQNGRSLNDDLLVGPRLQPELRHILMRWRTFPVCFVADIIKMYRQVKVHEDDTKYQRLLWRQNSEDDIIEYRMLRVTFGVSSAPYLAVKSLQQVAKDHGEEYPKAAERVLLDFYVDDLMSGCDTEEEAVQIHHEITELLAKAGFQLQKWASNSKKFMDEIQDIQKPDKKLEIKIDEVIKILGLTWDVCLDSFKFTVKLPSQETPVTKRNVLSDISRLFDPLGWTAPVIIRAKIFMQKLWCAGISWDQPLPSDLLNQWTAFRLELQELNRVVVPRWIHTTTEKTDLEIHGFSDASENAYAAVVYLRVKDENGLVYVSLLASRTRVAPVKQVSIARLELCGAELLANLLAEISTVMGIEPSRIHAWTDSTIVLAWLRGEPNRWKTFVANRVSAIQLVSGSGFQWLHVESSKNPADCASRGLRPIELVEHEMWLQGPEWLHEANICIPQEPIPTTDLEEKKVKVFLSTADSTAENLTLWTKYSSLQKLVRVIGWCQRFTNKFKYKAKYFPSYLTASDLKEALITCLKHCQANAFPAELSEIQHSNCVAKRSHLSSLCPFLDTDGIMRVRGRIQHSQEKYDVKHPIILPSEHHISKLVVAEAHDKTLHGGPQLMLNYIRSKFWIVNVKSLIRQHIRKCVRCIRYGSANQTPIMGDLPNSRVTISRPFSRCGVDYAGPINIRISKGRGCRCYKGYICLFICMVTRAIHLEAVSDLTTEGFLAAFKRFVARRGHVYEIWSDNGTNFVGASKELGKFFKNENSRLMDALANSGTDWHFIPPHAPNFGGLWEAGVKSTKFHLKRILDGSTLTFEELTTVLVQVEACLNSRPMYRLPSSQDDIAPLTPSHFLVGEQLVNVPDYNYEDRNVSSLRRWQLTQKLVQQFWRRWSQEYLTTLYHRHKWTRVTPEPNVGDVVLIKEDDLPPSKWLFGIIEEKFPGLDRVTRVVSLRTKNSTFKRPVSKLIVLPVAS